MFKCWTWLILREMHVKTGVKHPLISDQIPTFGKLQTAGKNTEKNDNFIYCKGIHFRNYGKSVKIHKIKLLHRTPIYSSKLTTGYVPKKPWKLTLHDLGTLLLLQQNLQLPKGPSGGKWIF